MCTLFQFKLYITAHCHLCDIAEKMLLEFVAAESLTCVEIADDATLYAQYALRIPVVVRLDTSKALDWPFSPDAIQALIA